MKHNEILSQEKSYITKRMSRNGSKSPPRASMSPIEYEAKMR
jgi:hypothetical protein